MSARGRVETKDLARSLAAPAAALALLILPACAPARPRLVPDAELRRRLHVHRGEFDELRQRAWVYAAATADLRRSATLSLAARSRMADSLVSAHLEAPRFRQLESALGLYSVEVYDDSAFECVVRDSSQKTRRDPRTGLERAPAVEKGILWTPHEALEVVAGLDTLQHRHPELHAMQFTTYSCPVDDGWYLFMRFDNSPRR